MTSGESNVAILTAGQKRRLLASRPDVSTAPSDEAWREFTRVSAAILDVRSALIARTALGWVALADSEQEPQVPASGPGSWNELGTFAESSDDTVRCVRWNGSDWTLVRLASSGPYLAFKGDWTLSSRVLEQLAQPALRARRHVSRRRVSASTLRLTHALGRASGVTDVCELALRCAVQAVPSRLAAFAIKGDPEFEELSIVATHGYPAALVRDVRVTPGQGVIGTVYQNRAPMRVDDVTRIPTLWHRRSRYRTKSFLAVPVLVGGEVMGVVCLADRLDDQPFADRDVAVIREVMAPAGLALAREAARRQAEAFAHAASIDALSGLFNRRYFHQRLQEELERAVRHDSNVALLVIDIDDFKQINDRFGHPAGDDAIRDIAEILKGSVRSFDVCTRYGGEEFAIVMPGADAADAFRTAERIRKRIADYRPASLALAGTRLTVSIGLAAAREGSVRDLVEAADRALYRAKHDGKNSVRSAVAIPTKSPKYENSQNDRTL